MNLTQAKAGLASANPQIRQATENYINSAKATTQKATVSTIDAISTLLVWMVLGLFFMAIVTSALKGVDNRINPTEPSINEEAQMEIVNPEISQ